MGIGKSTLAEVKLNHSDSFYYAGEKVTGIISFHNHHRKLTLNNVSFGFIGEVGYTGQKTRHSRDSMGNIQEETRTGQQQFSFINIHIQFTHSKDNEDKMILEHGHNSWPFEFSLPQNLPPSSGSLTGSYPYIKYYVFINTDRTWFKSIKAQTFPLIIFPNVNIFNINEGRQSTAVYNRNDLYVKACLTPQSILPGEKISLDIDIKNHKQLKIKEIEAKLIQQREIDRNHHAEVIFKVDLPFSQDFKETEFHENFDLDMPSGHLPPTYDYMASCSDLTIQTSIFYEIKLQVKVHDWPNEINLIIPIIVGTESRAEQCQSRKSSYARKSISYTAVVKEMDASPVHESGVEDLKF
ncbi:unnamed protein product [Rotaria sp. Silwood1]|nr:unnamed protein product [Rotaria sp. Silwood1]